MRHLLSLACHIGVILVSFGAIGLASAQDRQPADQTAAAAEQSSDGKGLLDELGKLLKAPADLLPSLSKPETPKQDVVPAGLPAADIVAPAPSTPLLPGMVTGRAPCPRAANGAPDCQAGSDNLCRSKGYRSGKSLNTDSVFSCSARQARGEGGKACSNTHFVTSAFCI